jgi:hypothetical protein
MWALLLLLLLAAWAFSSLATDVSSLPASETFLLLVVEVVVARCCAFLFLTPRWPQGSGGLMIPMAAG